MNPFKLKGSQLIKMGEYNQIAKTSASLYSENIGSQTFIGRIKKWHQDAACYSGQTIHRFGNNKRCYWMLFMFVCFGLKGSWGQPLGPNFPSLRATTLPLRLDCSAAAFTTPQKVLSIWRQVELKMLDFNDRTRTDISILTSPDDAIECLL